MLRDLLDQLMAAKSTSVVIVLAHTGALMVAFGPRKTIKPALLVNLIMAGGILAYNASDLPTIIGHADWALLALTVFALATLLCSAGALYGLPIPRWIIWSEFAVDFALSVLLMAFMFLVRFDRMI
jgi:hypothetical protein